MRCSKKEKTFIFCTPIDGDTTLQELLDAEIVAEEEGKGTFKAPDGPKKGLQGQKKGLQGQKKEPEAEKKEPEIKQKRTRRDQIDDGRILALRKAGWTLKDIGDDLGISQQTVLNHLQKMGYEKEEKKDGAESQ